MIKQKAKTVGREADGCCHTFRAIGITSYLENGGMIEDAQAIASHESPKTTIASQESNVRRLASFPWKNRAAYGHYFPEML